MDAPAVKPIPQIDTRPITTAEVMEWFARGREPKPNETTCAEVAARLTEIMPWSPGMRWRRADVNAPWLPEPDTDDRP
jgi:hypothetical protein